MTGKIKTLQEAGTSILTGDIPSAKATINHGYPFQPIPHTKRTYTYRQMMEQFRRDGFIDRYSGEKLVNPGLLKVFSFYMPDVFPYHPHWKMEECHNAYWELVPTVDHIYPVALGGADTEENWVTTSMLHNAIKSNWTLEQLGWKLHEAGDYEDYDGLTGLFMKIVEKDEKLLEDAYIKRWYKLGG